MPRSTQGNLIIGRLFSEALDGRFHATRNRAKRQISLGQLAATVFAVGRKVTDADLGERRAAFSYHVPSAPGVIALLECVESSGVAGNALYRADAFTLWDPRDQSLELIHAWNKAAGQQLIIAGTGFDTKRAVLRENRTEIVAHTVASAAQAFFNGLE
jgi:hypothetical protein